MSHEKKPGCLGNIGDDKLPSDIGIIINHYKDLYLPTSIMESKRVFFVAHMREGCSIPKELFHRFPIQKTGNHP